MITKQEINHLSWNEISFEAKWELFWNSVRKHARQTKNTRNSFTLAASHSELSSVFYSIIGTAGARLKKAKEKKAWLSSLASFIATIPLLTLAVFCFLRCKYHSDQVVALLYGYNKLPPEWCDVRQSILRFYKDYFEAKRCAEVALASDKKMTSVTRGLLLVGLADASAHLGESRLGIDHYIKLAVGRALSAEQGDQRQASRIYRGCARVLVYLNGPNDPTALKYYDKAQELAIRSGSRDQELKALYK